MATRKIVVYESGKDKAYESNANTFDFLSIKIGTSAIEIKETTGQLDFGNVKLTNIVAGTATGHAVEYDQLGTLLSGKVSTSVTVNGHALSSNVTVSKSDVGLSAVTNDAQLPLAGGTMGGNIAMAGNRLTGLGDGSASGDSVNYGQLQTVATQGKMWKEALLSVSQLKDGASGGLYGANVVKLTANLETADSITLNDGSATETYVAGTDFSIGGSISATLANLKTAINAGAIAVSAVTGLLDSIDDTNDVLVVWQDTIGEPTRIYGNAAAAGRTKILPVAKCYDGLSADLAALPASDPAATNFGFSRAKASLVTNETHQCRIDDITYTWDLDTEIWMNSGLGSVPVATKSLAGKVQIGDGIAVSSGTISAAVDGTTIQLSGTSPNKTLNVVSGVYATAGHNHDSAYLGIAATAADSDKLDGQHGSYYATASHNHTGVYDPAGTAAAIIASSISDGDTTHCPDGNSVYDALAGKSDTSHNHTGVYDPAGTAAGLIEDAIVDGVTTKAPSQNAVFDALTGKSATSHNHDSAYLGISATAADSDKLDGQHGSYYSATTHNHDSAYLGIAATAADSDKLDGQHGSYYATASDVSAISGNYVKKDTDSALAENVTITVHANTTFVGADLVSKNYVDTKTGTYSNGMMVLTNDNGSNIAKGKVVYVKSNGHVDLASAAAIGNIALGLVSDTEIVSTEAGNVLVEHGRILGGYTSLTPGNPCWLGTSGALVWSAPTSGDVVEIGHAVSATEIRFAPIFRTTIAA